MTPRITLFQCVALIGVAIGFSTPALAIPVAISNASFEIPILPDGRYTSFVPIIGWSACTGFYSGLGQGGTPPCGVFNPITGAHYSGTGTTDGNNTAYSNGGSFQQTLSATLTANTAYQLLVDVGHRRNYPFGGYLVELLAGLTVLASSSSPAVPNDSFITSTVNYFAAPTDPLIGSALTIRLSAPAAQANFDNVRLDATAALPTPEPAPLALISLGFLAIAALRRRRA